MLQNVATPRFQVDGTEVIQHEKPLTFDQPVGNLPIVNDARWSAPFTDHSLAALLVWVILLISLQAVAWPLVKRIFTRLPDRGWAFTRLITILIAGYGVWLLASVELISFRAIWAGVAILVVAGLSFLVSSKIRVENDDTAFWKNPVIIAAEVVFWSVFALFLLYRAINPDSYHPIWGGEKPMEFAHLNAILRSAHFPPVDPWYSGGYINYYYYGTYLVAFLIKLTGIPTEIAFNLAQPTFPALLAAASFSIATALGKRLTNSTPGAIFTGLLGAFFVQFAANFIAAARVLDRAVTGSNINDFSYWVFNPTRAIPDPETPTNITEFPYFGALYADLHPHVMAMPFTVLIIGLAWQISAQWRLLPMVFIRRRMDRHEAFSLLAPLFLLSLGLGTIFMTNAWDLPMYAAVATVGVLLATQGVPRISQRLALVSVTLASVGVFAWLLILPFTTHYVALFGKIDSVRDRTPLLAIESHLGGPILILTMGMAALAVSKSRVRRSYIAAQAVVSTIVLSGSLVVQWIGNDDNATLQRIGEIGVVVVIVSIWVSAAWLVTTPRSDFNLHPVALKTILIQTMALATALALVDRPVLGLYLGIGISAAALWFALQRPSSRFLAMLVAGGMLLGASLELVYLVDDLSATAWYRMNTIFKFYNQIWNLLGIAAAVLASYAIWETLVTTAVEQPEAEPPEKARLSGPTAWSWVCAALVLPIAVASLAYAVVATPIRLDQSWGGEREGLTLNAYAWMETAQMRVQQGGAISYRDDLAAIDWLNGNVAGTPVIAEAAFGTYRCNGSRFSIATGLPAVIGWQRHEQQQRYLDDLGARENALRELYTSPSAETKQQIIDRYDIEYIVVGQTEVRYPTINGNDCIDSGSADGIAVLEDMSGTSLEVAFQQGTTTIYRVTDTE
jgi:YYY domain-containing protein